MFCAKTSSFDIFSPFFGKHHISKVSDTFALQLRWYRFCIHMLDMDVFTLYAYVWIKFFLALSHSLLEITKLFLPVKGSLCFRSFLLVIALAKTSRLIFFNPWDFYVTSVTPHFKDLHILLSPTDVFQISNRIMPHSTNEHSIVLCPNCLRAR